MTNILQEACDLAVAVIAAVAIGAVYLYLLSGGLVARRITLPAIDVALDSSSVPEKKLIQS